MNDDGASSALSRALAAALRRVDGVSGVSDGLPPPSGDAHTGIDMGPEVDWGHKSGAGAEVRFAILVRCGGEAPDRARRMCAAIRMQVDGLSGDLDQWRLVSLAFQRMRTVREPGPRWTGVVEYRARLLASAP